MNSSKPDIAILLDRFGGGGVERVACYLANGLHKRGMAVEFVVNADAGPVRDLLDDGVFVHVLKTIKRLSRGGRLVASVPDMARYLGTRQPRIFHSPGNHTHIAAWLAVKSANYSGIFVPKITNPIIKAGMKPWKCIARRKIYQDIFELSQQIIVLSPLAVDRISNIDKRFVDKAVFISNPYVSDAMFGDLSRGSCSEGVPTVLSVGRLSKQKDHEILLRSLALLRDREWRLRICGDGPFKAQLVDLAKNLGIAERVEFSGFVSDIVPHYNEAAVMALSSRWEDLPVTLIEAMACGCPVVSTASSPAIEDLLAEVGGQPPVPVRDPLSLSRVLALALDRQLPVVPRMKMKPYSIEQSCDEHFDLFTSLIKDKTEAAYEFGALLSHVHYG